MWVPSVKLFRPVVVRNHVRSQSPVWCMRWRTPEGKRQTKTTGTTDYKAARLVVIALTEDLLRGCVDPTAAFDQKSWKQTYDEFCNERGNVMRPKTVELYDFCGRTFDKTVKPKRLQDIDTAMVERFASLRSKIGQAAASVNKEIRHVRGMLKWAARRHYTSSMPDFRGAFIREDRKLPVVVPVESYRAILKTVDDPATEVSLHYQSARWWRIFVRLAYSLGGRRGELLGLTWKSVDLEKAEILVSFATSKGRKDRRLPLVGDLVQVLTDWKAIQGPAGDDPILPCSAGMRQIYEDWWQIRTLAGVGKVRFKDFRSTCASELLMSGASTITAKEFLGHSTTAVLERHYANVLPGLRQAAEQREKGK